MNDANIGVELDDFGTGYSSLNHLGSMPVQTIKIDKVFVDKILMDKKIGELVEMIIDFAHQFHMKVIAEGVETEEQFLRMEVIMSEIINVSGVDKKSVYGSSSVKKSESSSDFSSFLGEAKSMDSIFDEAAAKYNMPVELLKAVGKAESNFNSKAVSRCGAQGVMQLMPATAKELGVTDSFNAEQNIMAGSKYLSRLMKKYDGNTRLALAAYNAGSGNVDKYNGIPPFKETQNYVKKVTNFMGQGNTTIAEANNTVTTKSNPTNHFIATAKSTPIHRNLAYTLTNESNSTDNEIVNLNDLFSYDDYLKFVELFLEDNKDGAEKKSEDNTSAYNSNEINYNVPVMNLLKNQKLF